MSLISLKDFPDDVYLYLNDKFREKFFLKAWKISGGYRKLAKKVGVAGTNILAWKRGYYKLPNNKKEIRYISFKNILKIINYCKNLDANFFKLDDIEKNIVSYRARHGILKVNSPILPINDSFELRSMITHLFGDGTAQNILYRTCKYDNSNKEAVEEFKEQLKCFGRLSKDKTSEIWNKKGGYFMYRFSFPKAIAKILIKKFNVNFAWNKSRFPTFFFNGDRDKLISIVRSFFIDEGYIQDKMICFSSGNINLLADLKRICEILKYKVIGIKKTNNTFYLKLGAASFKQIYIDFMKFGPLSIKLKQKRFEHGIKLKDSRGKYLNLESSILKLLSKSVMCRSDISFKLGIRMSLVNDYLERLRDKELVKVVGKNKGKGGAKLFGIC